MPSRRPEVITDIGAVLAVTLTAVEDVGGLAGVRGLEAFDRNFAAGAGEGFHGTGLSFTGVGLLGRWLGYWTRQIAGRRLELVDSLRGLEG
jgi:hypothetical protein